MRTMILLPFLGIASLSQAQPVITDSAQPQPGDACPYVRNNQPTGLSTSPGGGQIWDLTGISAEYLSTMTYLAASAAPGHEYFPTATLAATNDQDYYEFYALDPTLWSIVGNFSISSGNRIIFSDPETILVYPCTFGTQWIDPYSFTTNDDPTEYQDTLTVEFNAWGTVILPGGGTVMVTGMSVSSFEIDTNGTDIWTYADSRIDLFSPNSPCQVLRVESHLAWMNTFPLDGNYITKIVDDPDIGVQEAEAQKELELWPVPARASLNVRWDDHAHGADARLIDEAGRITAVRWTSKSADSGVIDVSGLLPGTYLLRLADDAGRWMVRSFVVQ